MNEQLYGLTRDNLLRMLPEALARDEGMQPLGYMTADAVAALKPITQMVKVYARIDELDEQVLDLLARDFKVDWYDFNYQLSTKRELIRDCFFVHRHLGTKGSVVSAMTDVYPPSMVQEWWEYGGDPYYFRAIIDVTSTAEPAPLGLIKKKINFYKPARSHLQDDNIIARISCGIAVGTSASGIGYSVPRCGTVPAVSTQGGVDDSDLSAATSVSGGLYRVPMCGTPFNALM